MVMSVYMVLLVLVPSPPYVAIQRRELLPRGFILTLSGGLFSVTAFIRLLPSALSAAGCPFQSGLSSETGLSDRSVLPISCSRACARACHFLHLSLLQPSSAPELYPRNAYGTASILSTYVLYRNCCARSRCNVSDLPSSY